LREKWGGMQGKSKREKSKGKFTPLPPLRVNPTQEYTAVASAAKRQQDTDTVTANITFFLLILSSLTSQ